MRWERDGKVGGDDTAVLRGDGGWLRGVQIVASGVGGASCWEGRVGGEFLDEEF